MTKTLRSPGLILWIGLIAGTLDITENLVFNLFREITPWRVFQYIASGLIGRASFSNRLGVGRAWRDFALHDRAYLDRNILRGRAEGHVYYASPHTWRFREFTLPSRC